MILKKLSADDISTLDKLERDFVSPVKRPVVGGTKTDSADTRDASASSDDFDLNVLPPNPKIQKEAKLKLKFGRMTDKAEKQNTGEVFPEYTEYFSSGSTEFFQSNKGLVFGFVPLQTFRDSFLFEADWKVRFLALQEIYLLLSKQEVEKHNELLWNINKFVFVQLNCGIKMEFLDAGELRKKRTLLLSVGHFCDGFKVVLVSLII